MRLDPLRLKRSSRIAYIANHSEKKESVLKVANFFLYIVTFQKTQV